MMCPILVSQFECGNQGREKDIGTIIRKVHQSSYYGPSFNGCCTSVIAKQTYLWVEYKGKKHVLRTTHHWPSLVGPVVPYEIVLPGEIQSFIELQKGA